MTWALIIACNGPDPDETSGSPSLWVADALAFDVVEIGSDEPRVETLWVENVGYGVLSVDVPPLPEDSAFSVSGGSATLERMEAYGYEVTFDPRTPFLHEGWLIIESNDPHGSNHWVAVRGEAFAPVIEVGPSRIDLGTIEVGCGVHEELEVRNGGNRPLLVTPSLELSSEIILDTEEPLTIEPGMSAMIDLTYRPTDATADTATLTLSSNDPVVPEVAIDVTGIGSDRATRAEFFEMGPLKTDIVLVVDDSASMHTEQARLIDHVGALVEGLDDAMVDFRIGVVSTDQSSLYGPVVTSSTTDAAGAIADQVEAMGTGGSGTQRALQMLYQCILNDCSEASGFLRDDALFAGIIVSDQPDQSALNPEAYVDYFWTLKGDPELVRIHALAGAIPLPTCGSCSSAGFGYDQAVELSDGQYADICADDWDEALRFLAEHSLSAFPTALTLGADPVADTIVVAVDHVEWESGWLYTGPLAEGGTNEIRFELESLPPAGSRIDVTYAIPAACE